MNNNSSSYLETLSNVVISITLFLLPVFFLLNTTDFFTLPKQILIIGATTLLLVLWGVKILITRRVVVNVNPINLPVVIFGGIILISAILSQNRFDSLFQAVPLVFAILLYFAIVNNIHEKRDFYFALSALTIGAAASALISLLYYTNVYFLPFPQIDNQFFNTFGSTVQQVIYLLPIFIFSTFFFLKRIGFPKMNFGSAFRDPGFLVQMITGVVILGGLGLIVYQIIALPNKPIILPYIYGFQTAFASISQDAQRFIVSLLFGSGYGTFLNDFTRFKLVSFNLEANIWNLNFNYSSSYFLELIATTGILGALSFIFVLASVIRTRTSKNPLFVAVLAIFALSFLLPFSYVTVALLFILTAIYVAYLNIDNHKKVYDITLSLVGTKSGMLSFESAEVGEAGKRAETPILSAIVFVISILVVGFVGLYTYKFVKSDIAFAESLIAANQNNGQRTYELQTQAINELPERSDYHRIFSQVNLALANSLAQGVEETSSPSAEIQQNIANLLQQSINSARNAVVIAPMTSLNWQNLAQIYRSLIGVGENAEQFAIASMNQAIALDPYNPQLYIQLGGIYYQLGQWNEAQSQFEVAINLKRDFANAYYNLGHTLEQQGDLQNALAAYQIVRQLSEGSQENIDLIEPEIAAITEKIGEAALASPEEINPETEQTPLEISEATVNLPEQDPRLPISPPPGNEEDNGGTQNVSPTPRTSPTPRN